jgi:hypothetical protein
MLGAILNPVQQAVAVLVGLYIWRHLQSRWLQVRWFLQSVEQVGSEACLRRVEPAAMVALVAFASP